MKIENIQKISILTISKNLFKTIVKSRIYTDSLDYNLIETKILGLTISKIYYIV